MSDDANNATTPVRQLELRLASARAHLAEASKALIPKFKGREMEEYDAARSEVVTLQRQVAEAKGEPYAVPIDFPVRWEIGAPMPHLLMNDSKAFLAFLVNVPDPKWDGTYVTTPDLKNVQPLALVEFGHCTSAKLGAPNDEVFAGHPLATRGLEPYTAQLVCNSPWVRELEAINSVHHHYDPELWKNRKHYVFWFKDTTFECVAQSFKVELFSETFAAMLARICQRLVS